MKTPLFLFDLDGTLTQKEIFPQLAARLSISEEMQRLTQRTLDGTLDFAQSLRLRFSMLHSLPLKEIHKTIAQIPLDPILETFIIKNRKQCALATGNIDIWIQPLIRRLGCTSYSSSASYPGASTSNTAPLPQLQKILEKGELTISLKQHHTVIAIGDSANDVSMLQQADIAIAFSAAATAQPCACDAAHHTPSDGKELVKLLNTWLK